MSEDRPGSTYRPNVGIALFNGEGRALIARRLGDDGPETVLSGFEWQMPQGGIDPGEDLLAAARRELWEETGVTHTSYLGEYPGWISYDFPPYDGPPHALARFRGQRQRWVAFRLTGEEREIDVTQARNGADPEFSEWRWERWERLPDLVVPFKREVYRQVAEAFARFAQAG